MGTVVIPKKIRMVKPINQKRRRNLNKLEEKNQALVEAIPFCGEYPGPWLEDKFRPANQMDEISNAGGDEMADS